MCFRSKKKTERKSFSFEQKSPTWKRKQCAVVCLYFLYATVLWSRKLYASDWILIGKFGCWNILTLFKFMPCSSWEKINFAFNSFSVSMLKVHWSDKQLFLDMWWKEKREKVSFLVFWHNKRMAKIMFQFWMTISASFFVSSGFISMWAFQHVQHNPETRKVHSFHYFHFSISISLVTWQRFLLCFRPRRKENGRKV